MKNRDAVESLQDKVVNNSKIAKVQKTMIQKKLNKKYGNEKIHRSNNFLQNFLLELIYSKGLKKNQEDLILRRKNKNQKKKR
jgi:hypothetical protein